jgi:hypothetical protein
VPTETPQADWAELAAECEFDPLGYVKSIFPWGEGELANSKGPRDWQAEELDAIGRHLRDPETRYMPYQSAVASGHDIGKSALVAMILKWALSCWAEARCIVTANTGNQLSSKTQPEVNKWFRMAHDRDFWEVQATRVSTKDAEYRANYRCDFETWDERNTEAFAGLHNLGKLILVIYDEASAISRKVWEVTKGALTDENTVILWFVFGNPTLNEGPFFECFGSQGHRWRHRHIDSRTVEGTNKALYAQWEADEGEDSDFFRVRVRGVFPRQGDTQFISSEAVQKARHYRAEGFEYLPRILACDVARFGDDQTVIGYRQGRKYVQLEKFRNRDTQFTANRLIERIHDLKPAATVVDAGGVGGGVVDYCKALNYEVLGFDGAEAAFDAVKYFNRRAEVWGKTKAWLDAGAQIPDDEELASDLTGPQFHYAQGKRAHGSVVIEAKEMMKKRGLRSPDLADTLCLTFAVDVAPPDADTQREPVRRPRGGWLGV